MYVPGSNSFFYVFSSCFVKFFVCVQVLRVSSSRRPVVSFLDSFFQESMLLRLPRTLQSEQVFQVISPELSRDNKQNCKTNDN